MHLRFGETESAFDYMMATRDYLEQHGKPLAFYSDKHGFFRGNNGGSTTTGVTHFGRVLSELGIELICANSPQAKGRVERANQTLQDRLIKEMRLEGISSIEVANAWQEFDEEGRMKPSAYYDRIVDVMEELMKFTLLTRGRTASLVDRYSERKESAEALSARVNQRSI